MKGYFVTILAGISFGGIPVIVALLRDADASIAEQAFLRLFLGGIVGFSLLIACQTRNKDIIKSSLTKTVQKSYFWQGSVFTFAILVYIGSIILETPVGEAALLIQIHPLITLILGALLLKEEISSRKIVALLLALIGMILLTTPWEWESFLSSILGDILATMNGSFYALYLLIGAYSVKIRSEIPFYISVSWILVWGFIWGLICFFLLGMLPIPSELLIFRNEVIFTPYVFGLGLLLAITGSIVPYGLIMLSNKYEIESSTQSILLLGEPISAMILGTIFLSEPITIWYVFGGIPLLIAIALLVRTSASHKSIN